MRRSAFLIAFLVVAIATTALAQTETWYKSPCNPVYSARPTAYPWVVKIGSQYVMYCSRYTPPQHIEYMTSPDGVQWTDHGNLISPGQGGQFNWHDISHSQTFYNTADRKYWMYYDINDGTGAGWRRIGLGSSPNGLTSWADQGEVLRVGASGAWDANSIGHGKVLYDDASGRYLMLYIGDNASVSQIGLAASTTGRSFAPACPGPVIPRGTGSAFDAGGIHTIGAFYNENGKFYCYYGARNTSNVWSIGKAVSDDGCTWTKLGQVLWPTTSWENGNITFASLFELNGVRTLYFESYPGSSVGIASATNPGTLCDRQGPETTDILVEPSDAEYQPRLSIQASADDRSTGGSSIAAAELFIDHVGPSGTGVSLTPADGQFDEVVENTVAHYVALRELANGNHTIFVRAQDASGNWGPTASASIHTNWSGFDIRTHGFHFANQGWFGTGWFARCVGMCYAAEFYRRSGVQPIPDNDLPLIPPDDYCPERTAYPSVSTSPTARLIDLYQWLLLPDLWATKVSIHDGWIANSSNWIHWQYELAREMIEGGHDAVIYLTPENYFGRGHAVLAYRTADFGNGRKAIYVYDPNNPNGCGQVGNRAIHLRENNGTWDWYSPNGYNGYTHFGTSDLWLDVHFMAMAFVACPVDIEMQAPDGRLISDTTEVPPYAHYGRAWMEAEDGDSTRKAILLKDDAPPGIYRISVVPENGASPDDRFFLVVMCRDEVDTLAAGVEISSIPITGYLFSTLDTGSVSGHITSAASPILGVPVDLYDSLGNWVAADVTDEGGLYGFYGLNNGKYTVSIATPLGYQADQETKEVVVRGLPHEVNFDLTKLEITPRLRTLGYWAYQLTRALLNWPQDYRVTDFARLTGLIEQHFNDNAVNPVDFYTVTQPASRADSLDALKNLLHMRCTDDGSFTKRLAKAQLMALMLNVVSGRVSQTYEVSRDGRTVSQAITYCDMLVGGEIDPPSSWCTEHLGDVCRYLHASAVLTLVNLGLKVPAGWIPEDVIQIAYKTYAPASAPTEFGLGQNYPNPFNAGTVIRYTLSADAHVRLEVYDILGRCVATLIDDQRPAGQHEVSWDGRTESGDQAASGMYFYRLVSGDGTESRKMVLLK